MKHIVLIGGANGTTVIIKALKGTGAYLSVIQTPADDGGSGGDMRREFSMIAPGDTRRALLALSELKNSDFLELFSHRYTHGPLKGQVVGNLMLAGLTELTGSFENAIEHAKKIMKVAGDIIPASLVPATLMAELENGEIITGETNIDIPKEVRRARIKRVWFKEPVSLNPKAKHVVAQADAIIIGPGDLYTSIIPNFLVAGMPEALQKAKGKKIYIVNPINKPGETTGFTEEDYVQEIEKYAGIKLDIVLAPADINGNKQELYTVEELRRALL